MTAPQEQLDDRCAPVRIQVVEPLSEATCRLLAHLGQTDRRGLEAALLAVRPDPR